MAPPATLHIISDYDIAVALSITQNTGANIHEIQGKLLFEHAYLLFTLRQVRLKLAIYAEKKDK